MFRKPRDTTSSSHAPEVLGRPPSPTSRAKTPFTLAVPPSVPPPTMATNTRSSKPVPLPTIGRQGATGGAKKTALAAKSKLNGAGNSSILSFFKKSESNDHFESGLFVEDGRRPIRVDHESENQDPYVEAVPEVGNDQDARYNEVGGPVKRRKTSQDHVEGGSARTTPLVAVTECTKSTARRTGPFLEESDSEQEEEVPLAVLDNERVDDTELVGGDPQNQTCSRVETSPFRVSQQAQDEIRATPKPSLIKEETSIAPEMDDFADFEALGDFDEDPFEEGDEYMERKYMEEQELLEAEDEKDYDPTPIEEDNIASSVPGDGPSCPICSLSLAGVNEQDVGIHVNNCLDGKPSPLPQKKTSSIPAIAKSDSAASVSQYRRPVRPAKPGQSNPFTLGSSSTSGGSAFNKLMSGHAEDAAWAEAAASEHASRGKPSYQRTCPFYKILPGLFICVDAFRYGAVQGCQAYFLSHFHSDHYVGLTSTWNHGPIYCSKVTGNLVRQQLRVDPKFVVPLEWEVPTEVPGTKGVKVTMISANHCPGSSLFLFEKVIGKRPNGEPRLQRILHCGDFRACQMHIRHPLLMPDVQDKVTGKSKEQKIDVCYLDTTYLNPKYAFPSQEVVIKACADMCVCLSKDTPDETDGWEQMKRQRAGEGMTKFVRKESSIEIKEEPVDEDDIDKMKLEKNPHASQQIISSVGEKRGRGRLLVVVGTYSIGKERICLGIAKALNAKIYAPPSKQRIVAALEDPELDKLMTNDPRAAQVHMTPLFEIRAETLEDYLKDFYPHFTRAVGFRPSGWNYRPPNSRFTESPLVQTVLHSDNWKSSYSMKELVPQRGSSSRASCFGVPYSEHSSFRELTMFCCALRIDKIIPTVNVGSAKSRERMKAWCERWAVDRRKNGLYKFEDGKW